MKNVIFYFTGTGNSLKIARDIAAEIGETELVPIPQAMKKPADRWLAAETIGFVFPVYFEGPPIIVEELVERLKLNANPYIFAVCNCGGAFGTTLLAIDKLLQKKNTGLAFGTAIKMPGNYLPMYGAYPEAKQRQLFVGESEQIRTIAETIKARRTGLVMKDIFLINFLSSLFHPSFVKNARTWDKNFSANNRCNHCGTCSRVCPIGNIELKDGKPVWNHRCEQCFACIQWCPQEAIQCGKKSASRKRYHHPEIKLGDLIQSVEEKG